MAARQARHTSGRLYMDDLDLPRCTFPAAPFDPRLLFDGDIEKGSIILPPAIVQTFKIYTRKQFYPGQARIMTTLPNAFFTTLGATVKYRGIDGILYPVPAISGVATPDSVHVKPPVAMTVPAIGLEITTAPGLPPWATSEFVIESCPCVNANVQVSIPPVTVSAPPATPLFVQDQFELVNAEVTLMGTGWTGTYTDIFDRDITTGITLGVAIPGDLVIALNAPLPINHIGITGALPSGTVITLKALDGTVQTWTLSGPSINWDSGPFSPVLVQFLEIVCIGPANIQEVTMLKGASTGSSSTPATPTQVEDLQQIVNAEVDMGMGQSELIGGVTGDPTILFDKDPTTEVLIDGAIGNGVRIVLDFPILISRVAFTGLQVRLDVTISVIDVDGNIHIVYDGSNFPAPSYGTGLDSGNFKDQPVTPWTLGGVTGPGSSPILATQILYEFNYDDPGVNAEITEMTILKTTENKSFCYNEPSEPVFVEDDQLVALDEVIWKLSSAMNMLAGDLQSPFKKNPGIAPLMIGPLGSYTVMFNAPKLVSRIILEAMLGQDIMVQYYDTHHVLQTLIADYTPVGPTYYGYDSGNIAPTTMTGILITSLGSSFGFTIDNLAIWKTFETKGSVGRAPIGPDAILTAEPIPDGETHAANGILTPPLVALAGLGISIAPDEARSVNVQIAITGSGSENTMSADVMWYYSFDNITFYFLALTQIRENPVTGNPSGYETAGGTCQRQIAMPEGAYNVFIRPAVRNNDTEPITVTATLVRQR